jgi:hypothetical protein
VSIVGNGIAQIHMGDRSMHQRLTVLHVVNATHRWDVLNVVAKKGDVQTSIITGAATFWKKYWRKQRHLVFQRVIANILYEHLLVPAEIGAAIARFT